MKRLIVVVAAICIMICALAVTVSAETKKGMAFPKDWETYRHIGSLIITDKDQPFQGIHHFYMNQKGLATFEKGGMYPDGTIIVDAVYEVVDSGGILNEGKHAFYPVMAKNAKMKETGGWEWYAFGPDGAMLEKDPKKDCLVCHESAKDSDYVLSKPLK